MLAKAWHGWAWHKKGHIERALTIGPYPNRKSIALYVTKGNQSWPIAYFRSEQDAFDCMNMLDNMILVTDWFEDDK